MERIWEMHSMTRHEIWNTFGSVAFLLECHKVLKSFPFLSKLFSFSHFCQKPVNEVVNCMQANVQHMLDRCTTPLAKCTIPEITLHNHQQHNIKNWLIRGQSTSNAQLKKKKKKTKYTTTCIVVHIPTNYSPQAQNPLPTHAGNA